MVCVLSVVEPCRSFTVVPNRQTQRLEVVHRPRKCLHSYLYLIDPEFGWMHVRLQTWAVSQTAGAQQVVLLVPDAASSTVTVQATVTLLVYQPLLPCEPDMLGVTSGGVASM